MAQILPRIRVETTGEGPGTRIWIQLPDLSTYEKTYLSADEASGQTTLSVISGINFSANEYVVIGTPGSEDAEIKLISSRTTSTIVVAATDFTHPRGTQITFIPFNEIEVQDDTDSTFGSPTTTTVNLRVDALETFLEDTDGTTATFYRARFGHNQGSRTSAYSDGVIATGYALNSVYAIKQRAIESVGVKIGEPVWLTDRWLNTALWEGRRELEAKLDKWSFRKNFESDIGNVIAGQNTITTPTTLRENTTRKNLLAVYIGKNRIPLRSVSKQEMNEVYRATAHTTLNGTVGASDTSITLTNSRDFTLNGSIEIAGTPTAAVITGTIDPAASTTVTGSGTNFDGEIEAGDVLIVTGERRTVESVTNDTTLIVEAAFSDNANDTSPDILKLRSDIVDYTDNDINSNTIRGVTNIHFGGWASGTDVWQGRSLGLPQTFTVTDDGIVFDTPFSFDYHDQNIYADYWGTFTDLDSDTDTLDEPDYDMFTSYLRYRIKHRRSRGDFNKLIDSDYQDYIVRSQALIDRERHEQSIRFIPSIEHLQED